MLRPPKSLDAAALASKIKKTKHEFNKMTSEVDAELTKVMERMAERKTWSRLDEVKQEEAVVHAAQAEASRRAAEAQERAANGARRLGSRTKHGHPVHSVPTCSHGKSASKQ